MRYFNPDPVALGKKLEQLERQGGAGTDVDEVVKKLLTLSPEDMASAVALAFQARAAMQHPELHNTQTGLTAARAPSLQASIFERHSHRFQGLYEYTESRALPPCNCAKNGSI